MIRNRFGKLSCIFIWTILSSCGDLSPKRVTSGSSAFGFLDYFIEPIIEPVVAIDNSIGIDSANASLSSRISQLEMSVITQNNEVSDETFKSQDDFENKTTAQADTKKDFFDTRYCEFYAQGLKDRALATLLYRVPSSDIGVISALVVEKAYLELMRNYCYTNNIFYLDSTRPTTEQHADLGELRRYRNKDSRPLTSSSDVKFDYLISQAKKNDKVSILGTFKQVGEYDSADRLYGRLDFVQTSVDERRFRLVRYFVDNDTKTQDMPDAFRWEGYAMLTTKRGSGNFNKVHYIVVYIADYVDKDNNTTFESKKLVIHSNQFVIHENGGSKMVRSQYCVYDAPVEFTVYKSDCFDGTGRKEWDKINNSDKTGSEVVKGYYSIGGTLLKRNSNNEYKREELDKMNRFIDDVVDIAILNDLSASIKPPRSGFSPDERFNPSAEDAHLDFQDPCSEGATCNP